VERLADIREADLGRARCLVLTGDADLANLHALVADAVVGFRIMEALGVPRGRMRDPVVVIGPGSVGYRVTQRQLDLGFEVAGAEISERNRWVPLVRRQGVPVLVADGRCGDSLRLLSVERARAVVAATDDDLANVEAALAARQLNPRARIVARLFDPEMAVRAQRQLGIDACHSVSALAARAFLAAALGEGVRTTVAQGRRLLLVGERRVEEGSEADGMGARELETRGRPASARRSQRGAGPGGAPTAPTASAPATRSWSCRVAKHGIGSTPSSPVPSCMRSWTGEDPGPCLNS
jgi:Trk K+ transport system NAD-binding subunit